MGDKAQRAKGVKTFWLWAHDPWGTEAVKGAHSSRPIVLLAARCNTSVFRLAEWGCYGGALDLRPEDAGTMASTSPS